MALAALSMDGVTVAPSGGEAEKQIGVRLRTPEWEAVSRFAFAILFVVLSLNNVLNMYRRRHLSSSSSCVRLDLVHNNLFYFILFIIFNLI